MTLRRRLSRRDALRGGAASLIAGRMFRDPLFKSIKDTEYDVATQSRMGGTPDFTDYRGPGGLHSPYQNFITVAKDGGDFTRITDALIFIQDNCDVNRFCIFLYPGIYDEDVVMKQYVSLVGLDRDVCIIRSVSYGSLVTMASHSSLNEIQVVNEMIGGAPKAVYCDNIDDFFIDSCILAARGNTLSSIYTVAIQDCGAWRILGSEIYGNNTNAGGDVECVDVIGLNRETVGEIRYTRCELESGTAIGVGIYVEANTYYAMVKVIHCWIYVVNSYSRQDGIQAGNVIGMANTVVWVLNTSIYHVGTNPNGYDLYARHAMCYIYVRSVKYSTWFAHASGGIIPFAGDRPRLECVASTAIFTLTAGASAWENDPNGVLTIDLPCRSRLKIDVAMNWFSDTIRAQAFGARVLVDGAAIGIWNSWGGEPAVNVRMAYGLSVCGANYTTGTHTVQLQVTRINAGDTVVVDSRQMSVMSDPWP